jgi:hypothetical protein
VSAALCWALLTTARPNVAAHAPLASPASRRGAGACAPGARNSSRIEDLPPLPTDGGHVDAPVVGVDAAVGDTDGDGLARTRPLVRAR